MGIATWVLILVGSLGQQDTSSLWLTLLLVYEERAEIISKAPLAFKSYDI